MSVALVQKCLDLVGRHGDDAGNITIPVDWRWVQNL